MEITTSNGVVIFLFAFHEPHHKYIKLFARNLLQKLLNCDKIYL